MNANELAEKLLDCLSSEDRLEIRSASAQMLRKQQVEIDSLKDKLMLAKQSLEIVEGWIKK